MPGKSSIEWTERTWNPVTGCSKVSPGCAHCYAEALTERYAGGRGWIGEHRPWTPGNAEHNVRLRPDRLDQPLRWRKPSMIFVNSMSDLFHELVPDQFVARVFGVMATATQHTFQVLTKRPERMRDLLNELRFRSLVLQYREQFGAEPISLLQGTVMPLSNVWLGTSVENRRFVGRADALRATPAAVRFISAEPLLGPLVPDRDHYAAVRRELWEDDYVGPGLDLDGIDWLIVGGESGAGFRPMRLEWARDLRDYAALHDVAFFMKQMGGHRPGTKLDDLPEDLRVREFPVKVAA